MYDCVAVTDPTTIKEFKIASLSFVIKRFPILNYHIRSIQNHDQEWRQLALTDMQPSTIDLNNILE